VACGCTFTSRLLIPEARILPSCCTTCCSPTCCCTSETCRSCNRLRKLQTACCGEMSACPCDRICRPRL
jgi:hypothetical protein